MFRSSIPRPLRSVLVDPSCRSFIPRRRVRSQTFSTSQHEPLHILFCGSDAFSIHSLHALHRLQQTTRSSPKIASIDVLCRPDKYKTGIGKRLLSVPIKSTALELNLPLHQTDTFAGWTSPRPYDLIIAVSFGLLIPRCLLESARFGGLNVHASLLPDLRGPAPIQWSLIHGDSHTGVSLQTLHPEKFDRGRILDQTAKPGVPISDTTTYDDLVETLGHDGAEMLTRYIESGSYATDPHVSSSDQQSVSSNRYAPKITSAVKALDARDWTADELLRRDRVIGPLWDMFPASDSSDRIKSDDDKSQTGTRIVLRDWQDVSDAYAAAHAESRMHIRGMQTLETGGQRKLVYRTRDGKVLLPTHITVSGRPSVENGYALAHLLKR